MLKQFNVKIIMKDKTIFRITYFGLINNFFKMKGINGLDASLIKEVTINGKPYDIKKRKFL
ncbi:MAG: hypothetical protein MJ214_05590 [Bacilli bacterium]|nr:hypothetical protein [Bacilli bacterium]